MNQVIKKTSIQIPKNISVIYNNEKKIITFIGLLTKRSLKLKVPIILVKDKSLIIITQGFRSKLSNASRKKIKSLQKTTTALIRQSFIEVSTTVYKKLNFIGVGYRAFDVEGFRNKLLLLKLGYSHSIYFKIPKDLKIICLKLTKLFVFGNSYQQITQTAALVRSYRKPEPYKGKGILYYNEKITLKEGKKV